MASSQMLSISLSQVTARTLELSSRPPTPLVPPDNSSILCTTPNSSISFDIHHIPIVTACEFIDSLQSLVVDDCKVGRRVSEDQVRWRGKGSYGEDIWSAWSGIGQGGVGRWDWHDVYEVPVSYSMSMGYLSGEVSIQDFRWCSQARWNDFYSWLGSNFSIVYHESTKTKADKITLFCPKARKVESTGKDLWRVSFSNCLSSYGRADGPVVVGQRGNILVQDVI